MLNIKLINFDGTMFMEKTLSGPVYPMTVAVRDEQSTRIFRNDQCDPDDIYTECDVAWFWNGDPDFEG